MLITGVNYRCVVTNKVFVVYQVAVHNVDNYHGIYIYLYVYVYTVYRKHITNEFGH